MAVIRSKAGVSGSGVVKPAAPKSVAAPKAKAAAPIKPLAEVIPPPEAKVKPAVVATPTIAAPKVAAVTAKPKPVIAAPVVKSKPAAPVAATLPKAAVAAATVEPALAKLGAAVTSLSKTPVIGATSIMESSKKMSENLFKSYGDLAGFGKGNVEAVVKSSTIVARGFEELSRQVMALAQSNMEHGVAAAKAALNCTTLKQIVDLQSDFAKTTFDKLVSEGNKLSEMSYKMTNEAIEPLQARVTLAVETFGKPLAA